MEYQFFYWNIHKSKDENQIFASDYRFFAQICSCNIYWGLLKIRYLLESFQTISELGDLISSYHWEAQFATYFYKIFISLLDLWLPCSKVTAYKAKTGCMKQHSNSYCTLITSSSSHTSLYSVYCNVPRMKIKTNSIR